MILSYQLLWLVFTFFVKDYVKNTKDCLMQEYYHGLKKFWFCSAFCIKFITSLKSISDEWLIAVYWGSRLFAISIIR